MTTLEQNVQDFSLYVLCALFDINYTADSKIKKKNIWDFFEETPKGSPASTLDKMVKGSYGGNFTNVSNRVNIDYIEMWLTDLIPDENTYNQPDSQDLVWKIESCYDKVLHKKLSLGSNFADDIDKLILAFKELLCYACLVSKEKQKKIYSMKNESYVIDYIKSFLEGKDSSKKEDGTSNTLDQDLVTSQQILTIVQKPISKQKEESFEAHDVFTNYRRHDCEKAALLDEECLKELVAQKDSSAMNDLALLYEYGSSQIMQNLHEAFNLYQTAAENNYSPAIYNLGDIYEKCSTNFLLLEEYGVQIEIDGKDSCNLSDCLLQEAMKWYQKAADNDYTPAIYKIGNLYEKQKEYVAAFQKYESAAKKGYPPAQNAMGYFYQNGIGIQKNINQARIWYDKAVEANCSYAFYNYALLEKADGNYEQACNLLGRVSCGNNFIPMAAYELAKIHEKIYKDIRKAMRYYQMALNAGILVAQTDLERCQREYIRRLQ